MSTVEIKDVDIPEAMQGDQNSTIVFPLPLDVVKPFVEAAQMLGGGDTGEPQHEVEATNGAPTVTPPKDPASLPA